jgi:hypothetical protein
MLFGPDPDWIGSYKKVISRPLSGDDGCPPRSLALQKPVACTQLQRCQPTEDTSLSNRFPEVNGCTGHPSPHLRFDTPRIFCTS